ncbi:MAG: hypothetical protein Q9164_007306, partial [Protoblastenia rupestris]
VARWTEDTRGQSEVLPQNEAKSPDSSNRRKQSSQSVEDRLEANPKVLPIPSRSIAQPPQAASRQFPLIESSLEPSLDTDSILSEFIHEIPPQYGFSLVGKDNENFSAMELASGDENMEFGTGPFSTVFQEDDLVLENRT